MWQRCMMWYTCCSAASALFDTKYVEYLKHVFKAAQLLYVSRKPFIRLVVHGLARDAKSVGMEDDCVTPEYRALFY